MSLGAMIIIGLAIAIILGGVLLLKKSAKKFNLSKQQLDSINQRNKTLNKEEEEKD